MCAEARALPRLMVAFYALFESALQKSVVICPSDSNSDAIGATGSAGVHEKLPAIYGLKCPCRLAVILVISSVIVVQQYVIIHCCSNINFFLRIQTFDYSNHTFLKSSGSELITLLVTVKSRNFRALQPFLVFLLCLSLKPSTISNFIYLRWRPDVV